VKSGLRVGAIQWILDYVVAKHTGDNYQGVYQIFFGLFVHTFESATYTEMVLTTGIMNLGGMSIITTLGQGEGCMCHCNPKKKMRILIND
jgi:hypothetical protein